MESWDSGFPPFPVSAELDWKSWTSVLDAEMELEHESDREPGHLENVGLLLQMEVTSDEFQHGGTNRK